MKTLFEKIWDRHVITSKDDKDLLYIDLHLIHEVTSPQAFEALRIKNRNFRRPDLTFATMDHNTPTRIENRKNISEIKDKLSKEQLETLEKNCKEYGIELFDMNSENNGIVHMIGPEMGLSLPGKTIVCGDSHTATHGAMGAIAFGIGTSEVEDVFATQCIWNKKPKNMGVKITGQLGENISSKDIILKLISKYSTSFGSGYAIEFYGDTIENMEMEQRLTLSNMAIEGGAKFGIIKPDNKTIEYIRNRKYTPKGKAFEKYLKSIEDLYTDDESCYDKIISLDVSNLKRQVSYGTNPSMTCDIDEYFPKIKSEEDKKSYEYMGIKENMRANEIKVDTVFIGSCTNGRIIDMKIAADVIRGNKVKDGIRCIIVPGSMEVKRYIHEKGLDKIFLDAGCELREPGCSYCLAMNDDKIDEFKHCVSTSNRNFEGRQGRLSRTHLVSPYTAALCAIEGRIV